MPELPEVEVVRRVLSEKIINKKIVDIECFYQPMIENDWKYFKSKLMNKSINEVDRLGKYLLFKFDNVVLISHLRMEGKYFYLEESISNTKHTHVVFHFDNGYKLCYEDVRKFGRMVLKDYQELYNTPPLSNVGVEANSLDFNPEELLKKINRKSLPIKTILLDQSIISGLGNIYVDEVLFMSKISPFKKGDEIELNEIIDIMNNSKIILDKSITLGGTTIKSYTSSLGVKGNYQSNLLVHTKDMCKICGEKIIKNKIGGRSTYYCKKCQEVIE